MCSEQCAGNSAGVVIDVRQVSKAYRVYSRPIDRFKQALARGRKQYYHEFWALRDVDLQVQPSEMVGIIGRNGSGKSTLLQIIAGTLAPTAGEVTVAGRVAALLELGSGFDVEATGVENIYMNGALLGLSREEINAKYEAIVAFADIGEFVGQPVKTYSSGMVVRLAFAVAAHVDARILIVDEALAVGDVPFQAKCFRRIERLREDGVTILLATHDTTSVSTLCDRAVLLDAGQVALVGDGKAVAEEYYRRVRDIERRETSAPAGGSKAASATPAGGANGDVLETLGPSQGTRMGDGRAEILGYAIYDARGQRAHALAAREPVRIDVAVRFGADLADPHVGVCLRDPQSRILIGGHTLYEGVQIGPVVAGQETRVSFELPMLLNPGKYLLTLGVAEHDGARAWRDCDMYMDYCELEVYGKERAWGLVNVPTRIRVQTSEPVS